jgi:hypothetical protein
MSSEHRADNIEAVMYKINPLFSAFFIAITMVNTLQGSDREQDSDRQMRRFSGQCILPYDSNDSPSSTQCDALLLNIIPDFELRDSGSVDRVDSENASSFRDTYKILGAHNSWKSNNSYGYTQNFYNWPSDDSLDESYEGGDPLLKNAQSQRDINLRILEKRDFFDLEEDNVNNSGRFSDGDPSHYNYPNNDTKSTVRESGVRNVAAYYLNNGYELVFNLKHVRCFQDREYRTSLFFGFFLISVNDAALILTPLCLTYYSDQSEFMSNLAVHYISCSVAPSALTTPIKIAALSGYLDTFWNNENARYTDEKRKELAEKKMTYRQKLSFGVHLFSILYTEVYLIALVPKINQKFIILSILLLDYFFQISFTIFSDTFAKHIPFFKPEE